MALDLTGEVSEGIVHSSWFKRFLDKSLENRQFKHTWA
jgi:hypothetical protein